ncbi:DUF6265 family protein [Flavobacterium wongokense]|uniref:DUF6265 family protein n=1 Tax=Flavobacterium wongokense TaxID=2910674 RepID=UPI001F36D9D5|nr:DUF6265 family protein [Flavobacterium sp. WG47]MCF6132021.1 DUF6265 family protein [Flavobacterium sp. WG47]
MKHYRLILLSALALCCLASCEKKTGNKFEKLKKMEWVIGSWEQKLPDGIVSEIWTKENDSTFTGRSFFIKEKDTIHLENIVLTQKGDNLLYIPTVNGQNNNEPTTFTMTSDAENAFSFENPAHDYPQKITYKRVNETNLLATISGKQQGKQSQESYPMVKK